MRLAQFTRFTTWLESRWVAPSYSGWLMGGLAIFFFAAATNTMAGWLYVISGVMLALLILGAVLAGRSLKSLQMVRSPISPVSVGDALTLNLAIDNPSPLAKSLIQIQDEWPGGLTSSIPHVIDLIPPRSLYRWMEQPIAQRRGIYRWDTVQLRTAAPLGLFWCKRSYPVPGRAIVYPTVLPLSQCPLIDQMGEDQNALATREQFQNASEGLTRSLRPYRWGDSTRLIHWRTSARYGELRVRELENYTSGQEIIIGLDSAAAWPTEAFEQAVIAAASLYFYALQHQIRPQLWTAATGMIEDDQQVLEALAATQFSETPLSTAMPHPPCLWLTAIPDSIAFLPTGSRWLFWETPGNPAPPPSSGQIIHPDRPLQPQLQTLTLNP
ncbi:MAG: DUF58 domain-containing protein [Oculatellaceae cyanobacterium Prado106]|jgi:uncharacterized protein (DUF58 family)|nr:DUF58 domain-containing protein [Oculatellaceae cyanobacterium Prado106]